MAARSPSGVLVLDKPRGPTSHDVVAGVRRVLRTRDGTSAATRRGPHLAVGHAGTLDPMATGVLVVAVGEATKLVPWLTAAQKSYEATIALGVETDTLDAVGRETRRVAPSDALRAALTGWGAGGPEAGRRESALPGTSLLREALDAERSRTAQVPPAFSAIQQEGERAYVRARRGEVVALPARPVEVHRLELVACTEDPPSLQLALDVAKGYYVRALARDLAAALGTVGHLTSLRRTRSGCFTCAEAVAPDLPGDALAGHLLALAEAAARALLVARLTADGVRDARHGKRVQPADLGHPPHGPCAWLDERGELVAVGELEADGRGRVLRGFATPAG